MLKGGDDAPRARAGLLIHQASEVLGVPAPTLRSWERRYGLPTTVRTPGGHRRYTDAALTELGLMRDEVTIGRAPAEAARRVRGFIDDHGPAHETISAVMAGSTSKDPTAIRAALDDSLAERGLALTIDEVVLPAMRQVGSWWESGRCDVGQEHFTTEVVRGWLAKMTALAPPPASDRWVLLAVGPRDQHTLGLESLAALLVTQGTGCRILGPGTSLRVLVVAVAATSATAVVVVSHLSTQRRSTVESLKAVAATGCPTYYAGNAFLFPGSRRGIPGTYLGESITAAAAMIQDALPDDGPPHAASAAG